MKIIWSFIGLISIVSCQEAYVPERNSKAQYVVEGFIEAGVGSERSFLILSQSLPFLDQVSATDFNEMFVKDALVQVTTGTQTVTYTEICLSEILQLPPALIEEIELVLGFKIFNSVFDFCIYVDLLDELERSFGKEYQLNITIGDTALSANTTIPEFIELTEFNFSEIPGAPIDSLRRLNCFIEDPKGQANFYRYKVKIDEGPVISPFFSVSHDIFFDGQRFEFPLDKAWEMGKDTDFALSLFYTVGDPIIIKWHTMDQAHFDFWNTLEFNKASQGPLSSYTRIAGNIDGALGVWGGYAVGNYSLVVN